MSGKRRDVGISHNAIIIVVRISNAMLMRYQTFARTTTVKESRPRYDKRDTKKYNKSSKKKRRSEWRREKKGGGSATQLLESERIESIQ
jgi:hypothetical protein